MSSGSSLYPVSQPLKKNFFKGEIFLRANTCGVQIKLEGKDIRQPTERAIKDGAKEPEFKPGLSKTRT